MGSIKEVIQDIDFKNMHRINEVATISRPGDNLPKSVKVCIYVENDEQGTKIPHYHIIIDHRDIELEVKLEHAYELNIWRTKRNYPKSWDEITNVRDAIRLWLDSKNLVDTSKTNLELMVITWNLNNPNNEIDKDFVK